VVNRFDSSIFLAIDAFVGKFPNLDRGIEFVVGNDLIQGTLAASIVWWYWFQKGTETTVRRVREHLIATIFASIGAIIAGRALALSLPFRIRPRWEPSLAYTIPSEANPNVFINWSSFPSDHAILFAALATGFWFISARVAAVTFLYYLFVGALPLMYLGYHYPTDIIAGSVIGILIGCVMNLEVIRRPLGSAVLKWERASPSSFVVALFIVTFQIASSFVSVREAALALSRFIARVI
jgi:membrane-associated phospholipid phosphatase